jgi:DNA-directed RNA polymerase subunit beta
MNDLEKKFYQKVKKYSKKCYSLEDFAHLTKRSMVADDETNRIVNDLISYYR